MPLYSLEGKSPTVHPTAFAAPTVLHAGPVGPVEIGTGGTELPDGVLAIGAPARVMGQIEGTNAQAWVEGNPAAYQELAQRYLAGCAEA